MATLLEAVVDHGAVVFSEGDRVVHTAYLPCGDEGPFGYKRTPGYIDTNGLEWNGWTREFSTTCHAFCHEAPTGMASYLCHLDAQPHLHFEPKCAKHSGWLPFEAFTPFAAAV